MLGYCPDHGPMSYHGGFVLAGGRQVPTCGRCGCQRLLRSAPAEPPEAPTMHLGIFILGRQRSACGERVLALSDLTSDLSRVDCPECRARVVTEVRPDEPREREEE